MTDRGARSRILLVTRNLPPLVGGMERLNWHMANELAKFGDVRVVGPRGSGALAPAGIAVDEAPLDPLWRFLWSARRLALRAARSWRPDVVLAGSGLVAPIARAAARACGAHSGVYVHGLDVAVGHPAYRALWLPAIRKTDRVVANSRATADLCLNAGVDGARLGIVHPGVDLPPGQVGDEAAIAVARQFRARHGFGQRPLLLSVGRLSTRKGLREFVANVLPRIAAAHPDVLLLIVGETPKNALHAEAQTPASVQKVAAAADVAAHVAFLGAVSDVDLDVLYRAADLHVFPVREIPGNPEGFGMVAIEAAARGLPTVAFAAGGLVDAVADGQSGCLVAPGDDQAFADAVIGLLARRPIAPERCADFARQFAWAAFGAQMARQLGLHGAPTGNTS